MKNIFYSPKAFRQFEFVVEKLKLDLNEIRRGCVPEDEALEYVHTLLNQLTLAENPRYVSVAVGLGVTRSSSEERQMLVLQMTPSEPFPFEEYVMYVLRPTYIALSILTVAYMRYESVRSIEGILETIDQLMKSSASYDFRGHGFDALQAEVEAMEIFTLGQMDIFLRDHIEMDNHFRDCFNESLKYIVEVLDKGPIDGYFGEEDYRIEADRIICNCLCGED